MNNKLIMPSHIVIKDGLACGDKVTLLYEFDEKKIVFQIISDGCNYCSNMCDYLQNNLSNQNVIFVQEECEELLENVLTDKALFEKNIGLKFLATRMECCAAPIHILHECVQLMQENSDKLENRISLYVDKMDCDACATRENVSWLFQKPSHLHGQYEITNEAREFLMRLGKIELQEVNVAQIREKYKLLGENAFEFMEEYKLLPMVYQNLTKIGVEIKNDPRWRLLIYQRQRTVVAYNEIHKISSFISKEKLKAYWVKGAFTKKLYKDPLMRNLTDFDLIALNGNDAFTIIEYLLAHDFKIFPDSFSLKKTKQGDSEVYTGHLHFQKIINFQYRLIVDVNFTGFPMIRIASYVPQIVDDEICIESMIVITLCHLFKHKEVFIKDINDLYLMLIHENINEKKLVEELEKNELCSFFMVVAEFLIRDYDILQKPGKFHNIYKLLLDYKRSDIGCWPYSTLDVVRIKKLEFKRFIGEGVESERMYLYPTIIFKNVLDVKGILCKLKNKTELLYISNMKILSENIYQLEIDETYFFVLTPIGVFLEMKEYYVENMKPKIRNVLEKILEITLIECLDIPYAIAFQEKWLDD